jgi:hypothetical protein
VGVFINAFTMNHAFKPPADPFRRAAQLSVARLHTSGAHVEDSSRLVRFAPKPPVDVFRQAALISIARMRLSREPIPVNPTDKDAPPAPVAAGPAYPPLILKPIDPIDRFYTDLHTLLKTEGELLIEDAITQQHYDSEWKQASRPGPLWLWALWRSAGYDRLTPDFRDLQRCYENNELEFIRFGKVLGRDALPEHETKFRGVVENARIAVESFFDTQHLDAEQQTIRQKKLSNLQAFVDLNLGFGRERERERIYDSGPDREAAQRREADEEKQKREREEEEKRRRAQEARENEADARRRERLEQYIARRTHERDHGWER